MKFVIAFDNWRWLAFSNKFNRFANAVQFCICRNERRHGVYVIAERPEPYARFADDLLDVFGGGLRLEFQDADGAQYADIGCILE